MDATEQMSSTNCCLNRSHNTIEAIRFIDPLLGLEAKTITLIVNYFTVCGTIAFFGIIGNIINIVTFSKQGYDNTMNISLSGMAVSDICTLLFMIWWDICLNPQFIASDYVVLSSEVQYLTAGWPHILFARITCIITVFITMERCLCVVFPLRVKQMITKPVTIFAIIFIFASQLVTTAPSYYNNYIDWKFFPDKNRSLLGMYRRDNWEQIEIICFVLQSTMQGLSFTLLIFFTVLLIVSLRRKTERRNKLTSAANNESITSRDKRLIKMVILIALILIVCFTPGMIEFGVMAFEPEYTMGGALDTVFYVSWSFPFICHTFNSSVNILIYYKMSSRYKETADKMFYECLKCVGLTKLVAKTDIELKPNAANTHCT